MTIMTGVADDINILYKNIKTSPESISHLVSFFMYKKVKFYALKCCRIIILNKQNLKVPIENVKHKKHENIK